MNSDNKSLTVVLFLITIAGVAFCLWRITASPTPNEALLLSILLTISSTIASWFVSRYFAEASFNSHLRVFALKAAEKVTNLSNEFDRLSAYLQQALKDDDYESPNEALLAKNIRFEGAIHLINTLKSVNDGSLSDWQGVIGKEIDQKREEEEERQEQRGEMVRDLVERFQELQHESFVGGKPYEDTAALRTELSKLRADLRLMASQVGGVPIPAATRPKRTEVDKSCPKCGKPLNYSQKTRRGSEKLLDCSSCGTRLLSRSVEGGFNVTVCEPVEEAFACPSCLQAGTILLNPVKGSVKEAECGKCKTALRISRASGNEVRVRLRVPIPPLPEVPLSEELIAAIKDRMGAQPWPHGQARKVAQELGIRPHLVARAISELIKRHIFAPQIEGVLYAPIRYGDNGKADK
jgi:hypothetical protein